MTGFAYTVTGSFEDSATADAFVAWLAGGHAAAVIAGGARSATIVRIDPEPPGSGGVGAIRVDVRYEFNARADFERYLAVYAPALKAEGLAKFGPERGVRLSRSTGEIAATLRAPII